MAKRHSASSAYAASLLQKTLGRIPGYAPTKRTTQNAAARAKAAKEAAHSLLEDPHQNLHSLKLAASSKHSITFLKNSEILRFIPKSNITVHNILLKSPTRTLSGISPVALMPLPALCGGHCVYCPRGEGAPQSYTGYEPTTMRAIQNHFSARLQIQSRIRQYAAQGHATDKCHLIIMGGTFLYSGIKQGYRHSFMKEAFETLNGRGAQGESARTRPSASASSLKAAIDANEFAPHRAIGVTFETRPDFGFEKEADEMLSMGGTQVEMGVQALSDRVYKMARRGHTVADVVKSTAVLKNSGFKLCYHMMPGLFSKPSEDIGYFKTLFTSQDFQPDMLKIYPVLVLQGTPLYNMWKRGDFTPYDTETAAEVIAKATKYIPPYVRIPRIQRDIPVPLIAAGVKHSNLRQIVDDKLRERGEKWRCIRCREI
ncbi:Uncharacterised protein [uncultured archaeon]|nr:Uncharacterised protein [uncultured archaeon]